MDEGSRREERDVPSAALLAALPCAAMLVDHDGHTVAANALASPLFGLTEEQSLQALDEDRLPGLRHHLGQLAREPGHTGRFAVHQAGQHVQITLISIEDTSADAPVIL